MGPLVLDGVRILSLAGQYPGPFASMLLADWGADVVNVERPRVGDAARAYPGFYSAIGRNKRSVELDLKDPRSQDAFHELVRTADVVLEGYRPGVAKRLRVDFETLKTINPQLVYVSITGFGQDGPYRDRPGHDLNFQALAGVLLQDPNVGMHELPEPPSVAIGDLSAGLLAACGVLLGLLRRSTSLRGMYVDVSMLDGLVSLMATHVVPVLNGSGPPGLLYEPGYGSFWCADGLAMSIGIAHEDHFWQSLVEVLGLSTEIGELPGKARLERKVELRGLLAAAIVKRTRPEWAKLFDELGVPFGEVLSIAAVADDPQVVHRRMIHTVTSDSGRDEQHVRQPLTIDGMAPGPTRRAPALGEHTREILSEAGLSGEEIDRLVALQTTVSTYREGRI